MLITHYSPSPYAADSLGLLKYLITSLAFAVWIFNFSWHGYRWILGEGEVVPFPLLESAHSWKWAKRKKAQKYKWCVLPPSSSSSPSVSIYTGVGGALETASNTNYGVYSGPAPLHIISRYILPQRGISGTYRRASDVWWCYTLLSEGSIKTPEIGTLYSL